MSGLGEETFLPHQSLQSPGSGLIDRNSVTCMSLSQPPWTRAWNSLTGLGRGLLTSMKTGGVHATLTSWTSRRIRSARWASQTDENYRRKCPSLPPGEKGAVRPGALGQVIFPWDSLKKQQNSEQLGQSRSHDPPAGSEVPAAGSPVPPPPSPGGPPTRTATRTHLGEPPRVRPGQDGSWHASKVHGHSDCAEEAAPTVSRPRGPSRTLPGRLRARGRTTVP